MFIGARSHVGELHWTWNNGTKVADTSNFSLSDTSVCEEMTWPLTYGDGINLRAKDCSKEAHYVCKVDGNTSLLLFSFNNFCSPRSLQCLEFEQH